MITIGVPVNAGNANQNQAQQEPREPNEPAIRPAMSGRLTDLFNLGMGRNNNESNQNQTQTPTTNAGQSEPASSTNPRVVTIRRSRQPVTNPTTSTNTMSTSRPHVRVGTPFGLHPRLMPQGMVSSFDR